MRPDAPMFTPPSLSTAPQDLTIVPYMQQPTAEVVTKARKTHLPQDLVLHEAIRSLVTDIAALSERYDTLETANAELKAEVQNLKMAMSTQAARVPTQATNMCGYASSEASSNGEEESSKNYDNKFLIIQQILVEQQQKIDELSAYKKQSSELFASLKAELEGATGHSAAQVGEPATRDLIFVLGEELASIKDFLAEKAELLEPAALTKAVMASNGKQTETFQSNQLASAVEEKLPPQLETMFYALTVRIDALEQKVANSVTNSPTDSKSIPPHLQHAANKRKAEEGETEPTVPLETLEKQVDNVKRNLKRLEHDLIRRFKYEALVDDAATKDALYRMYHHLGEALWNERKGGRSGPFHGCEADLFTARTRVIRRLALFDSIAPAMNEAKAVDIDLSDG